MMKKNKRNGILIIAAVAAAFLIGLWLSPGGDEAASTETMKAAKDGGTGAETLWTCSMHPQVRQPEPGDCPLCAMDLIPISDSDGDGDDRDLPRLHLSERSLALMNIRIAPVARQRAEAAIRLPGRLAADETRRAVVSSWFGGRVDRLFVDFVGTRVVEGEHLAELYSPQLFGAQEEYLQAVEAGARQPGGSAEALVEAARTKLQLLGLSPLQIEALHEAGRASTHLTAYSPVSGTVLERHVTTGEYVETGTPLFAVADLSWLWAELEAFESDLGRLRYGQEVAMEVKSFPGEVFRGKIAFIDTQVDPQRRTARVRVNVSNSDRKLKPGMLVFATVQARLAEGGGLYQTLQPGTWISPMHPEIVKDGPGSCDICGMDLVPIETLGFYAASEDSAQDPLVIPASAPLFTGPRSIVYVRLPDEERPVFEAREVVLGPRAGEVYTVQSGLKEGELVVVNGQFKIDSELQIRGRPSMMARREAAVLEDEPASLDPRSDPVREPWAGEGDPSFGRELQPLLEAVLDFSEGLAADDAGAARSALERMQASLGSIGEHRLTGAAHGAWMRHYRDLREILEMMAAAEGVAGLRKPLQALTLSMESVYVNFGAGQLPEVARAHCPMVEGGVEIDGQPIGTWLQRSDRLANPYWGAMMLRCGDFHGSLGGTQTTE